MTELVRFRPPIPEEATNLTDLEDLSSVVFGRAAASIADLEDVSSCIAFEGAAASIAESEDVCSVEFFVQPPSESTFDSLTSTGRCGENAGTLARRGKNDDEADFLESRGREVDLLTSTEEDAVLVRRGKDDVEADFLWSRAREVISLRFVDMFPAY